MPEVGELIARLTMIERSARNARALALPGAPPRDREAIQREAVEIVFQARHIIEALEPGGPPERKDE